MSLHTSSKFGSTLCSTSKVTETLLATQEVVSSAKNEKANDVPAVTATKTVGPAAGAMTDKFTQLVFSSSFKVDGGSWSFMLSALHLSRAAFPARRNLR